MVGIQDKEHDLTLRAEGNLWEVLHGGTLQVRLGVSIPLWLLSGEETVGAKGAEKVGGKLWYLFR